MIYFIYELILYKRKLYKQKNYATIGRVNAERSNRILFVHSLVIKTTFSIVGKRTENVSTHHSSSHHLNIICLWEEDEILKKEGTQAEFLHKILFP